MTITSPTLRVFLAGATLFFLELHVGHALAPALGGGALVWLGTLLIFQVLLLVGYATSGLLIAPHLQRRISAGLLLAGATFATVGLVHGIGWGTLLTALGLTTVLPLTLRESSDDPARSHGRWIAASNGGALLGLALYAVAEPRLGLSDGATVLRIASLVLGLLVLRGPRRDGVAPDYRPRLAAAASAFVGVFWYMSHHARLEAASPPSVQLWAVTLGLYLLSFGLPFLRKTPATGVRIFAVGVAAAGAVAAEFVAPEFRTPTGLIALFVGSLSAHFALRGDFDAPRPWVHGAVDAALGGAIGGAFALVVTPLAFTTNEQILLSILFLVGLEVARARPARDARVAASAIGVVAVLSSATQWLEGPGVIRTVRSWYGEFRVLEKQADDPLQHHLTLEHQHTVHGAQYLADDFVDLPAAYYSIFSGAGMAIEALQDTRGATAPVRFGIVGLGTGALASYADGNDSVRFFEIDRRNAELNRGPDPVFRYLELCEGEIDVVIADGRRALAREDATDVPLYDVLVLDAFSGGNVPSHLVTQEAFELYARRVRRDGWILVHTSNKRLDLRPVLYGAAAHVDARAWFVRNRARANPDGSTEDAHLVMLSDWVVIGWDDSPWPALEARLRHGLETDDVLVVQDSRQVVFDGIDAWTDDRRSAWTVRQSHVGARERAVRPGD